ncbi:MULTISPECIES: twin-arginine translocase subunit TatC [unclassified Peribacillus]|uniref:twin-arginine translocase subunit TatC n=1 Tax=unclassified Peribacillus TaxID=2675266 RepID=UPI001911B14A|nr:MULTISPECIES: twin-arginine translocase subunit TatC [unclassified Peribacillus]MBK5445148.1 twin-arginine translocase subunit TatC [Peribacillus sp. TH24]MBK5498320.1 twin-arginine translocase subunit TatC [Peribacillus sp. TH14]WMX56563.1 twin-arginine translocase subunit TatC [Peribacillus sp. R9-11]
MTNQEMLMVEHLEELRKRIINTLIAFLVFLIGSFIFVNDIYTWLIRDLGHKLAVLGPSEILWVYFMISGVIAIALTIPIAAYQTWLFVKPALSENERKTTLAYIPGLFILFIAGLSFGYFVVYPTVLGFLLSLSEGQFETMFTSEKYFKFMINLTLPFGFLFEIPLVVMFLTSLGVVNPMILSKARKIAYFLLVVVAILITPPDFMSDILVTVPLLILYEFSVTLSKIVYRKKLKQQSDNVIEMRKTS